MAKVLIIEPSATLRHAVQRMLEQKDHQVTPMKSWEAGHEMLRDTNSWKEYQVIIIGYPVNSLDLCDDLLESLKNPKFRNLAVLLLAHLAEPALFNWVARRPRSALLLWDDYTDCSDCVGKLLEPVEENITAEPQAGDDIRVLFVDDSRTVRASFTRLLKEHGYIVETANNVSDAMQKARSMPFDIAIVDYFMPGGNGDFLCRRLRDDPKTSGITTAILTGSYLDEVIKDSLDAGAVECMFKNEATELFLARVAAMSRSIRIKKSIEAERQRLSSILGSVGDGVYGVNISGQISFINPAAIRILGISDGDSLIGRSAHKMFHYADENGKQISLDACVLHRAYCNGEILDAYDTVFWHHTGKPVPVECTVFPLRVDGRLDGSVIAFRDVSERKLLEKELMWQANHDPLTKLYNRNCFERQLDDEVMRLKRSNEMTALLYIDLDRFKYINDTAGHTAGDQLLIEISEQLKVRLRESDLLARIGGDEFAIILRNVGDEDVHRVADSFREVLEEHTFVYGDKTYKVNGSIGVSLINKSINSPGEALANADIACHIAKGRGRNQTHIYLQENDEKVAMNMELGWSNRLQDALKNNTFELLYQPIVATDDMNGNFKNGMNGPVWEQLMNNHKRPPLNYEVLVRFVDPRGELISPNAFLPTAERFGLMQQIDTWVLTKAVERLCQLKEAGIKATFNINLSGQSLESTTLAPLLRELMRAKGLLADSLILEITETSAIANLEAAKRFINELRGVGCRFALDDFGSGFSSFNHLKHLPVDFIKIDGQFIQGMVNNPTDRAIVASINDIAHSFGKKTIAEFVENAMILDLLREQGIDFVQGYYISMPASDFSPIYLPAHPGTH